MLPPLLAVHIPSIMHQPLTVADEEGLRFIDGQVEHGLFALDNPHPIDCAVTTVKIEISRRSSEAHHV